MRVLVSCNGLYSHLAPIVQPVADSFMNAGHEVIVVTGARISLPQRDRSFEIVALDGVPEVASVMRASALLQSQEFELSTFVPVVDAGLELMALTATPRAHARAFAGVLGVAIYGGLKRLVESRGWRPDLVIRESTEFGGLYLSESLGVPLLTLDIAPMSSRTSVSAMVNHVRKVLGIDSTSAFRQRKIAANFLPPSAMQCAVEPYMGLGYSVPSVASESNDLLDCEMKSVRNRGGPFIVASLGSSPPEPLRSRFVSMLVGALDGFHGTCVVLGNNCSGSNATLTAISGNVYGAGFLDQSKLVRESDLFISHGGFNGVREALASGVPNIALPVFGDQFGNAKMVETLGVGFSVSWKAGTDALRSLIDVTLSAASIRDRATRLACEFRNLRDLASIPNDVAAQLG